MDKKMMSIATSMLLLKLLSEEDKYGYQMIRELEERSEKFFFMNEGTIYPILHNLEKEGMIRSCSRTAENGRRRKYYSITEEGRAKLEEYKLQWIDYKTAIETFLGDADNPVQAASDADDPASGTDNENQENLGGNDDE